MSRPEIGELAEGSGGGSSTMPNKSNPTLSVLVRRAALTTPQLAATLHLAAAQQVDDRADGGWHAEWATLRDLARRTLVAASQTVDLVDGLRRARRPDGARTWPPPGTRCTPSSARWPRPPGTSPRRRTWVTRRRSSTSVVARTEQTLQEER